MDNEYYLKIPEDAFLTDNLDVFTEPDLEKRNPISWAPLLKKKNKEKK